MTNKSLYIIDSDVLITAKNRYYAFDICPGFWKSIIHHYKKGSVYSIDRVKHELLAGRKTDNLVQWTSNKLPSDFFRGVDDKDVTAAYTKIMMWVQRNPQYFDAAKAKFAAGADGWLVAYAMVHHATVVTNEQPAPQSKIEIKIPDICAQFKVPYKDTFFMLKDLAIQFDWKD
jgi:hypothetical protein